LEWALRFFASPLGEWAEEKKRSLIKLIFTLLGFLVFFGGGPVWAYSKNSLSSCKFISYQYFAKCWKRKALPDDTSFTPNEEYLQMMQQLCETILAKTV
jgi:hypothetical protein